MSQSTATHPAPPSEVPVWPATPRHRTLGRKLVGGLFLVSAGIHIGLVSADVQVYRHFADGGLFPFVREGWQDVVMVHPAAWCLLLAAGELLIGTLLMVGGRAARWGWIFAIGFHLLLMLFGFGFWLWSVPALVVLVVLARNDRPPLPGSR
jgi:hypothetical protein